MIPVRHQARADVAKDIVHAGGNPAYPYSRAVKAAGLAYVSGTLAQDATGRVLHHGDVRAQTRLTLERMREVLAAAGSSLEQVAAVTVYLTTPDDFQAMNEVYRTFWPASAPARTTVITELVAPGGLVEITMVAAVGVPRRVIHPSGWMPSPSPYSYAVAAGETVFLSGLVPRAGRNNAAIEGDVGTQSRAVLENAGEILAAAGLSYRHVVSARVYLTRASDFTAMNAVYGEYFPHEPPARATVQSALAGSGFSVEMSFTASSAPRAAIGDRPGGLPLSPAVRAGDRLYVSGMLGNTPQTSGDPRAQTHETLARIRRTLEASGASPEDVVESVVYLTDAAYFAPMNEAYRAFFRSSFPARTTVVTPLVAPDGLVEIMMTAHIGAP
jgi:2-iminobutanoate/2-iminopropanoate deaminase